MIQGDSWWKISWRRCCNVPNKAPTCDSDGIFLGVDFAFLNVCMCVQFLIIISTSSHAKKNELYANTS